MRIRKITSLTALLSFIPLFVTSIVLYIVPQGRVAFWANWRLWGLSKTQWANIHITTGLLFTISIFLHIYFNWKPMMAYLKNRARKTHLFTINFNVALLITLFVVLGTYFQIPPMSSVIHLGNKITLKANMKYGEPPYGHAELSSLKIFASRLGLDLNKSKNLLKKNGIKYESAAQTIKEVAVRNGITPQRLFEVIKPKTPSKADSRVLPDKPLAGFGKRSLADFCQTHYLSIPSVLQSLSKKNFQAEPEMTMKAIAEKNHTDPLTIYQVIKKGIQKSHNKN